jgi:hypothetical protein
VGLSGCRRHDAGAPRSVETRFFGYVRRPGLNSCQEDKIQASHEQAKTGFLGYPVSSVFSVSPWLIEHHNFFPRQLLHDFGSDQLHVRVVLYKVEIVGRHGEYRA